MNETCAGCRWDGGVSAFVVIEPLPDKQPGDEVVVRLVRLELRQGRTVLAERVQNLFEIGIPSLGQMQLLQEFTDAAIPVSAALDLECSHLTT